MAKNITELMSFFDNPEAIVKKELASLFAPASIEKKKEDAT
jgi:hypothetical protein